MPWSTPEVTRATTTNGSAPAPRAGAGAMCCRISGPPSTTSAARTPATALAGRSTWPTCGTRALSAWPSSRPAEQAGYQAPAPISTAPSRKASALYQVYQKDGRRFSAARAFLGARTRPNLDVIADCQAERLVFEGNRATGLLLRQGRERRTVHARGEIVLSAGAFGSPALLMASGIGPGAHLQARGVHVLHDAPEWAATCRTIWTTPSCALCRTAASSASTRAGCARWCRNGSAGSATAAVR